MDVLTVLAPTLWCTRLFGLSSNIVDSIGVRHSRFLHTYRYFFSVSCSFLQVAWFAHHGYLKFSIQALKKLQENLLLFCVCCNLIISLLPLNYLFSDGNSFHQLLFQIYRYEREIFSTGNRKLKRLFIFNVIILLLGLIVPVAFTTLEALKTWSTYSIENQHILVDAVGLGCAFMRPSMDIIFLDVCFMYTVVYGTIYENVNESLSRYAGYSNSTKKKLGSYFFFSYLKILEDLDNILKDFHMEIRKNHSSFFLLIIVLVLCNWFYVVGFIFLNMSPLYTTYYSWVIFLTIILLIMICGNTYALNQIERTPGLLHEFYIECDNPRILEEVEILSLQLLHRKVEFDSGGFFKLNFGLLISMAGTIITHVLILIQFEDTVLVEKNYSNKTIKIPFLNSTGH